MNDKKDKSEQAETDPGERAFTGHPDHPPSSPDEPAEGNQDLMRRLEENPEDKDAQLDVALKQSMIASDPPSTTQPDADEPPPSSGAPD